MVIYYPDSRNKKSIRRGISGWVCYMRDATSYSFCSFLMHLYFIRIKSEFFCHSYLFCTKVRISHSFTWQGNYPTPLVTLAVTGLRPASLRCQHRTNFSNPEPLFLLWKRAEQGQVASGSITSTMSVEMGYESYSKL